MSTFSRRAAEWSVITSRTRRLAKLCRRDERSAAQLSSMEPARPDTSGSYETRQTAVTEWSVWYHTCSSGPLTSPKANMRRVRSQLYVCLSGDMMPSFHSHSWAALSPAAPRRAAVAALARSG